VPPNLTLIAVLPTSGSSDTAEADAGGLDDETVLPADDGELGDCRPPSEPSLQAAKKNTVAASGSTTGRRTRVQSGLPARVVDILIAGAIGAWVPDAFWQQLFLTDNPTAAAVWGR
jgi:hypothetical protein